jgi:hypothetical protein
MTDAIKKLDADVEYNIPSYNLRYVEVESAKDLVQMMELLHEDHTSILCKCVTKTTFGHVHYILIVEGFANAFLFVQKPKKKE